MEKSENALWVIFALELMVISYGLFTINNEETTFVVGGRLLEFVIVLIVSAVLAALVILIGYLVHIATRRP